MVHRRDLTTLTIHWAKDCTSTHKQHYTNGLRGAQHRLRAMLNDVTQHSASSPAFKRAFGPHGQAGPVKACLEKLGAATEIKIVSCASTATRGGGWNTRKLGYEFGGIVNEVRVDAQGRSTPSLNTVDAVGTWIHELSHGICGTQDTLETHGDNAALHRVYYESGWKQNAAAFDISSRAKSRNMHKIADAYRVYAMGLN
ncbi:hypothetical protein HK405_000717 [Cladochytrium tenue]|nr:hypothetical protein HK405_000717 [Cladochytrium tenue]